MIDCALKNGVNSICFLTFYEIFFPSLQIFNHACFSTMIFDSYFFFPYSVHAVKTSYFFCKNLIFIIFTLIDLQELVGVDIIDLKHLIICPV